MNEIEKLQARVQTLEDIVFAFCRAARANDPDLIKLHNELSEASRSARDHGRLIDRALFEIKDLR